MEPVIVHVVAVLCQTRCEYTSPSTWRAWPKTTLLLRLSGTDVVELALFLDIQTA